jgi:hypothetical protein
VYHDENVEWIADVLRRHTRFRLVRRRLTERQRTAIDATSHAGSQTCGGHVGCNSQPS